MRVSSQQILNDEIKPILRRMAGPMVIAIVSMMAFQAVDTFFISMLGTRELAAISFTFPVTFTITSMVIGLSIAVSILVGSAIGSGNQTHAAKITTHSLLLTVLLVFAVSASGFFAADWLFELLGANAEARVLIHEYMDIWFIYTAFLVIPIVANGAIRATGDTKWPSLLMVGSGLVNVVLDPILIFGVGPIPTMGMAGAAYATVISWILSFIGGIYLVWREQLLLTRWDVSGLVHNWGQLIKLGLPISGANMLNPILIAVLTAFIANYGEHAVAAFGAGGRVETFGLVLAMALTAALSPFMAQNIGAGKPERAHQAFILSCRFIIRYQLIVWFLMAVFARPAAELFSDDPAVIENMVWYLRIMPAGSCFYAVLIIVNTAFNANHHSYKTLCVSALRLLVFVAPSAWVGGYYFGEIGLFCGAVVGNAMTAGFGMMWYLRSGYKKG